MITFASSRIQNEWNSPTLEKLLKQIVTEAAEQAKSQHAWDFHLTSIYRTPEEDGALNGSGIHTYWRAVDVRSKDVLADSVRAVTSWINAKYIYDPQRPDLKVCFSEPHGTGPHMHFQIHPNTVAAQQSFAVSHAAFEGSRGLDISSHNGKIDWKKVKQNKEIDFIIIRLSLGYNSFDNSAYENAKNAKDAGKKISFYHFAYPDPKNGDHPDYLIDAKNEGGYFRNLIDDMSAKGLAPDLPLAIDLEDDRNYSPIRKLTPTEYFKWITTFFSFFPDPVYRQLLIYGSPAYLNGRLPASHTLGTNPLWVAHYGVAKPAIPKGWTDYTIWQFSEKGQVEGITGNCDLNEMKDSIAAEARSIVKKSKTTTRKKKRP